MENELAEKIKAKRKDSKTPKKYFAQKANSRRTQAICKIMFVR
jgi:hypothetical protein